MHNLPLPTTLHEAPTGRFARMTAAEVLTEVSTLLTRWATEDTTRRARNAAILAAL